MWMEKSLSHPAIELYQQSQSIVLVSILAVTNCECLLFKLKLPDSVHSFGKGRK